ncbi:MAG: hypothetical protein AB4911_21140 [Oscillochloridaceae bacterium umkhey_bin13]
MLSHVLFWLVVIVFVVGHALLIHSAWRLRHGATDLPAQVPQSHGPTDLLWTLATAGLSGVMLYAIFLALPAL